MKFVSLNDISNSCKNNNLLFFVLILLVFLSVPSLIYSQSPESLMQTIENNASSSNFRALEENVSIFIGKFPRHEFAIKVEIILADSTPNHNLAISRYRAIINKYNNYNISAYAQFKICSIFYLISNWTHLKHEASIGRRLYNSSIYHYDFDFFTAKALFHNQQFSDAFSITSEIIRAGNEFFFHPEAKILHAYLSQRIKSNSNEYINELIFNYNHFKNTGVDVSSLFLLGREYENRENYDFAHSAYSDIIHRYPKSPEAKMSKERLKVIINHNPKYNSAYMRPMTTRNDFLNLRPDSTPEMAPENSFYCVEISPFYNLQECIRLLKELEKYFNHVFIIRERNFFAIYVERVSNAEQAQNLRIRIAEEFGLNSKIRHVKDNRGVQYYYEN